MEKVNGIAAEAGVKEKDHIKRINEEAIQSLEDFENHIKGQQKIVLYISRGAKINKNKIEFAQKVIFDRSKSTKKTYRNPISLISLIKYLLTHCNIV